MLMNKLQIRFGMEELRGYFSVNTLCEDTSIGDWATYGALNPSTEKIKCMPSSFPSAIKIVDKLYKTFN